MGKLSKLPSEVKGASYVAMWERLTDLSSDLNGVDPAPELPEPLQGGFVSRLSNLEVIAICRAWRRAAARTASRAGDVASVGALYGIELAALGWREPGDKFQVWENAPSWPTSAFDSAQLAAAWATWATIATELDNRGTKVAPLYLDLSRDGFRAGARETYARLLAHDEDTKSSPALPPEAAKKPSSGSGWLWLLLLAAAALGKD